MATGRPAAMAPLAAAFGLLLAAGCGFQDSQAEPHASPPASVEPSDFAIRHCGIQIDIAPCLIVHAGGKTLLFGAPEGAMGALQTAASPVPDAVLLYSLHAENLEGLARVRNLSWLAGRNRPLLVIGPPGTESLTDGIDDAFAFADAQAYVERRPAGGFEAATLAPRLVMPGRGQRVFDTGDLTVDAQAGSGGEIRYRVTYRDARLDLGACGAAPQDAAQPDGGGVTTLCARRGTPLDWPHDGPLAWLQRGPPPPP